MYAHTRWSDGKNEELIGYGHHNRRYQKLLESIQLKILDRFLEAIFEGDLAKRFLVRVNSYDMQHRWFFEAMRYPAWLAPSRYS